MKQRRMRRNYNMMNEIISSEKKENNESEKKIIKLFN